MLVHDIIKRGKGSDLAMVDADRRITYSQMAEGVKKYRNRLHSLGIGKGDRVAIFARNSAEFVYTYFGATSLGAICVPINFQLSLRETAFILKDAGAKILLSYTPLDLGEYFSGDEVNPPQYDIEKFGEKDFEVDAPELPADFADTNPCVIIYTSGTTGNPKGAVLSHKNLVRNCAQIEFLECSPDKKVICVLPMYHCFGWTCVVLYSFWCGASIFVVRNFTLKETVDMIRDEGLTDLYVVPSICRLITKHAESQDLKTVRLVLCGGTTLPQQIIDEFTEKFGVVISDGYGLSEASPVVSMARPGTGISSMKAIYEIEVKTVDDKGTETPVGEPGELWVRGDNVMLGYWNNPTATAEAIDSDCWLHTGDVATIDSEGYVKIVNRIKDMIISMGENIYPQEVEEVIYKFDGIKETAVVGIPDKLRGQTGACFYVRSEGAEIDIRALKKFLQKNLALYKVPREFHELKELPRTSTGKISKKQILEDWANKKLVEI